MSTRKEIERSREWVVRNPEKARANQWRSRLKIFYGITPEKYVETLVKQGNRCAICRDFLMRKDRAIDHCHRTGKFRGILCRICNLLLGCAKDDPRILLRAIGYLHVGKTPQ